MAQTVKRLPTRRKTWVHSLGQEDPLEKEMATHSSTHAWKIPCTEEPGRLQSMGSQRVEHDWATSLSLYIYYVPTLNCFISILLLSVIAVLILSAWENPIQHAFPERSITHKRHFTLSPAIQCRQLGWLNLISYQLSENLKLYYLCSQPQKWVYCIYQQNCGWFSDN